jgi:hypothetical protein
LSCDKNLNSYQGKIGKHIVWDTMPLKGVNKVGKEDKKGLPQLKRWNTNKMWYVTFHWFINFMKRKSYYYEPQSFYLVKNKEISLN